MQYSVGIQAIVRRESWLHSPVCGDCYSDQPFGVARDRGDSFVPMAEFQTKVADSAIRAALLKHKIVEGVTVPK